MVICREHVLKLLRTCGEHLVNMWWICGENVVYMWWACSLHVVYMWWTCGEHVVNMSCHEARGGEGRGGLHIIWPYIMFCVATSKNLSNLVIYEIWRKNVSDRRTDGRTYKVRYRGATLLKTGFFLEENAGFSAQIHRVTLTKTWFKKRHVMSVITSAFSIPKLLILSFCCMWMVII